MLTELVDEPVQSLTELQGQHQKGLKIRHALCEKQRAFSLPKCVYKGRGCGNGKSVEKAEFPKKILDFLLLAMIKFSSVRF